MSRQNQCQKYGSRVYQAVFNILDESSMFTGSEAGKAANAAEKAALAACRPFTAGHLSGKKRKTRRKR